MVVENSSASLGHGEYDKDMLYVPERSYKLSIPWEGIMPIGKRKIGYKKKKQQELHPRGW